VLAWESELNSIRLQKNGQASLPLDSPELLVEYSASFKSNWLRKQEIRFSRNILAQRLVS
jgi:hypothetical protein